MGLVKPGGRMLGAVLLGLLVALLVLGPLLHATSPTDQNLMAILQGPSAAHPAGTDQYGRDVLARIIHGGRPSLVASVCIVVGALMLGFPIGLLAAGQGALARILTRLIDILMAFPSLIMALAVVGALGIGMLNLLLAFVIVGWPYYARLVRGFAVERSQGLDIRAARAAGVSRWRVLWGHMLPHAIRGLAVAAGLDLGYTLASLAGFSYLGLGAQAPAAEWGLMLRDAQMYFTVAPWLLLGPSAGIAVAVLGTVLMTERDRAGSFGR
jgi:ABC-type dipeptide/oligopeptide/nickel transport system permease subunit